MFYIFLYFIAIFFLSSLLHRREKNKGVLSLPSHRRRLKIVNDLIRSDFSYPTYLSAKEQSFAVQVFNSYDLIVTKGAISADFVRILLTKIASDAHFYQLWVANYSHSATYSDILAISYWYESKAVRKIEDWTVPTTTLPDLEDYFHDLIPFLFEKYEVPKPLRNIWRYWDFYEEKELSIQVGFTEKNIEQLTLSDLVVFNWYFEVAQGENIRKNAYLPFEMSKNALFYFYQTNEKWSLMQAFRWAKTKGIGATDEVANLMAMELPYFGKNESVVEEIAYLLMRSGDFDAKEGRTAVRFLKVTLLGDYCHEYNEDNYFLSYTLPTLSLKGKNIRSIVRYRNVVLKKIPKISNFIPIESITWNEVLQNEKNSCFDFFGNTIYMNPFLSHSHTDTLVWNIAIGSETNVVTALNLSRKATLSQTMDFRIALMMTLKDVSLPAYPELPNVPDVFHYQNNLGVDYEVVRLKNYLELYQEGRVLDHCVGEYDAQCLKGASSIWSLRQVKNDTSFSNQITIEWCSETQTVSQAQGFQNADPEAHEQEVINAWRQFILNPSENFNPKKMQARSEMAVPA